MPVDLLDLNRIPRHIACVMDGNGRWAQTRGLPRTEGHRAGEHSLFEVVDASLEIGVEWLTVFAFSTENWRRPRDEVRFLINFNEEILVRRRDELNERGVRIRFVGRRDWRVPKRLIRRMDEASELTAKNRTLTFTIAFNYGGRAEIVDAVRRIAASGVAPEKITETTIARNLYDPEMPDPDLVIRTSGSTGSRTSCCGSWPTASWYSPILPGLSSNGESFSLLSESSRTVTADSAVSMAGTEMSNC